MKQKKSFFIITFLNFIFCFLLFPYKCYADELDFSSSYNFNSLETSSVATSLPSINSRAAIVIEKNTGCILFSKNENEKRKMASTTKIMSGLVVLENVRNLSETVIISKKAAGIGGSRLGLRPNDKVTVLDLLYGLLLCSGNDSAVALAEFAGGSIENFANLMNKKASELGLSNTHFVTPHGLDNEEHYTTAYELAILTKYALQNDTFSKIVSSSNYTVSINGSPKTIHNTNELLGNINGVYGVKTGFTNGANRCLVSSCKRGDLDIICVVLGADTKKLRTQDSIKLIEYTFSNFEMVDINSVVQNNFYKWQLENTERFYINKGIYNKLETYLEKFPFEKYPLNKSDINKLDVNISCSYYFDAPLLANSKIGELSCFVENKKLFSIGIYSSSSIFKKTLLDYFLNLLENYCIYLENIFD